MPIKGKFMENVMTKREFLAASVGTGLILGERRAFARQASAVPRPNGGGNATGNRKSPSRKAKTTKLFKSPDGFPNGLAIAPEGLWIAEQKLSGAQATAYRMSEPKSLDENAWLVDWNGKV